MRPVDRGKQPQDDQGQPVPLRGPADAKPHLEGRLGPYCSYCERYVPVSLAVEHKQPKSVEPSLATEWSNLLLACANCNSAKPRKLIDLAAYYWPDTHNTARAFTYLVTGEIETSEGLTETEADTARRTLSLTGLDRRPGHPEWRQGDKRWSDRREVWKIAQDQLDDLARNPSERQRLKILRVASEVGFFSIWMTVFRHEPGMLKRFMQAFPGTDKRCFGEQTCRPEPTIERPWIKEP